MAFKRVGTVSSHGHTRAVAHDSESGRVDRQYGSDRDIPRSTPTSRLVSGRASSPEDALDLAQRDLDNTFRRK